MLKGNLTLETVLQQANPNNMAVSGKPVRVLHVVEASVGGIKTYLLQLLNGTRQTFQVEVACPRYRRNGFHDTDFTKHLDEAGITWHEVPMVREISPLDELRSFIRLYKIMKHGHYDIVHTHSSKAGFLGRIAAKFAGIPVIVHTPNAYVFTGMSRSFYSNFYALLEKVAGRFGDKIICVSESEKAEALRFKVAPPAKLVVVKNSINPNFIEPKPSTLTSENGKIVIGAVGRLTQQKGFEYLIRALPSINRTHPQVEVWLIGDGELHHSLRQLAAKLGVTEQVKFLGFRDDVTHLIELFRLVAVPSLYEGLSFWLLEAMLGEKAIVATDVLGINDVITSGYNGLLVPARDATALSEAICTVLNNPEQARQLGSQARQTVLEQYSLDRMITETTKVYLDLIEQKEGRLTTVRS